LCIFVDRRHPLTCNYQLGSPATVLSVFDGNRFVYRPSVCIQRVHMPSGCIITINIVIVSVTSKLITVTICMDSVKISENVKG